MVLLRENCPKWSGVCIFCSHCFTNLKSLACHSKMFTETTCFLKSVVQILDETLHARDDMSARTCGTNWPVLYYRTAGKDKTDNRFFLQWGLVGPENGFKMVGQKFWHMTIRSQDVLQRSAAYIIHSHNFLSKSYCVVIQWKWLRKWLDWKEATFFIGIVVQKLRFSSTSLAFLIL